MRVLCFLVALLCAGGCVRHKPGQYPADLVAIDSMIPDDAEKAMALLADYDADGLSRTSKAYYGLLYTIAADKLDSVFQSDSLINDASYRLRHDPMQHARSMFYSGLVRYRINKEDTVAFQRMVEARNICEKYKIEEPFLRGMIASYIGQLQFNFGNFEQALCFHSEALNYSNILNDTLHILYDKAEIARAYVSLERYDEAASLYDTLMLELNRSADFKENVISGLAMLYSLKNETRKAIDLLIILEDNNAVQNVGQNYALSYYYDKLNLLDSALCYGERAVRAIKDTSGLYHHIYWRNGNISCSLGRYREAAEYYNDAYRLYDKYGDNVAKERLIEIEKRYDMLRVKQESAEEKAQLHKYIAILVVALLIVLIVLFLHYIKHTKRKAQETEIQDNLQKQKVASNALLLTLKFNAEMDERLEIISNKENIANINIINELQKLKKQTRKVTLDNIYKLLIDNELMADTDELNGFKFTKEELLINYFMNQGWDNKQIAQIICSTPQIVKTKKYQINQKIDVKSAPQPLETE